MIGSDGDDFQPARSPNTFAKAHRGGVVNAPPEPGNGSPDDPIRGYSAIRASRFLLELKRCSMILIIRDFEPNPGRSIDKKPPHLLFLNFRLYAIGEGTVWMQIVVNGAVRHVRNYGIPSEQP
jgi:hypothetical protein